MLLLGIVVLSLLAAVLGAIGGPLWLAPVCFAGTFVGLVVLAALFLLVACQLVDKDKPQEQESIFFRRLAKAYVRFIVSLAGLRCARKAWKSCRKTAAL